VTAPVFFVETSALAAAGRVVVDGDEGHHATVVRRLRIGEAVTLTDGQGCRGDGVVVDVAKGLLTVVVDQVAQLPRPTPLLTVVQALPKSDRGERAVAALAEVGVDIIVPWSAERCVMKWAGPRGERGLARWRSTAAESAKQSRRVWWPAVTSMASTDEVSDRIKSSTLALVLHESAEESLADAVLPSAGEITLVVGPEGGLTDDELDGFRSAGGKTVQLGPTVLRTSTAGVVAAAVVLAAGSRWSTA